MKQGNRKGNNNYWGGEYSHKVAARTYKRKAPKDLHVQVVNYLKGTEWKPYGTYGFTIEGISKELSLLHRHVHSVVQKLERRGIVKKGKSQLSGAPTWINDAMHDHARHPNLYFFDKTKL